MFRAGRPYNFLHMLRNFFKTAWRSLLRQRVNTSINVLGLALGITVCLIIFLLVRFELSYDRFHPDKDRIYRVVTNKDNPNGEGLRGFVPNPVANALRNEVSGLETVAGFDVLFSKVIVQQEGKEAKVFDAPKPGEDPSPVVVVQPQYFDIFKYRWLAGNAATALKIRSAWC